MILKIEQQTAASSTDQATVDQIQRNPTPLQEQRADQQDIDESVQALLNDPEIDMLYREVKNVREQVDLARVGDNTVNRLRGHISEYLNTFVLLGYDLHGRRILVQHTPRQTHADAIQKYLEHVTSSNLVFMNANAQRLQRDNGNDEDDED